MRMLALGEELARRGHEPELIASLGDVGWLAERVARSAVAHRAVAPDSLDAPEAERVVVDSYRIDPGSVSALARDVPVLVVVDGGDRGVIAPLYLDPTPGASVPADRPGRTLAGADYVLVRSEVLALRRSVSRPLAARPRVVVVMGGVDPTGALPAVLASLARELPAAELVPVTTLGLPGAVPPTPDLPLLISDADLVVSASGTSAWDICTMGVPAVLVAVVDNQRPGAAFARAAGIAGVAEVDSAGAEAARVLADATLREERAARGRAIFDGRGAERVADALLGG